MKVVVAIACALLASACEQDLATGSIGSSIVLLDAARVAVVDLDAGSVSVIDSETLAPLVRTDVGARPRALCVGPKSLWVAVQGSGEVVELALDDARVLRRAAVCAGPRALAMTPSGELLVACEWDGTVQALDHTTLSSRTIVSGLHRPMAVAAAGEAAFALESGGTLWRITAEGQRSVSLVPQEEAERPALSKMSAHEAAALALVDGGRSLAVVFELVNPSGDGNGEPIVDDYGSVTDGKPKINPSLRAFSTTDLSARDTPTTYARYDGDPKKRHNGPSALAVLDDERVLVAHRSSASLAVVSLHADSSDDRLGDAFDVGAGASGVAIDRARGIAWVDDAFDATVTRVALDDPSEAMKTTRVRALPMTASPVALEGRRSFFDSTNLHLSPAGVVTCGTCHPEGGDDGVVWFIRSPTIPAKRRSTPNLANAGADTAPYHWDGAMPDRPTLVQATVTNLMAGDDLLVDGDAIAAYLDELVPLPHRSVSDASAVARGGEVFTSAGCATCHTPPLYTDRMSHGVLPAEPDSPTALPLADTPSLRAVFLRTQLLHDGRSPSLEDLTTRGDLIGHGNTLSDADRADLVAFLRSL